MKRLLLFLLLATPVALLAQNKGIHFEHNLSWTAIQAKAKAEHKYIFMDCFTTWCGPCRYMSANIFPQTTVGDYFNKNFISVKVQLDTTDNDNAEVKSWYQSGHDIKNNFVVDAYPTYLFFDENGNPVHRTVGSSNAATFIAVAVDAKKPEKQYYTLLGKYNEGRKDSSFLKKLTFAAMHADDMPNAKKIGDEYLATQTDLYTKTNLEFIFNLTQSSKDRGFDLMLNNTAKTDAVLGKGIAEKRVMAIIVQEIGFNNSEAGKQDWDEISSTLVKKYPKQATEALSKAKVIWYQHNKDWGNYQFAVKDYMLKFGADADPEELNNYAWSVFQNCKDMTCVSEALDWSKRSFAAQQNPAYIDTYANILYKMNKKKEAIVWEKKAAFLATGSDKKGYMETLDKMNKGQKTWND